ncbi:chorismate--pyruvate lyase family protein [Alteromonas sp. CYL-A6]|uniref:chorismate--pyruvate lyase family protein n=1 Tax=Alteromonas nitratireducens TaxID=3390813 RepID=UPI0034B3851F
MQGTVHFPVGLDVEWHAPTAAHIPDAYLKNWLLDTGSLTERVQALCRQFDLTVLGQGSSTLHAAERDWLNADDDSHYDVREVLLVADGTPWVFARSVIPHALIKQELANLGSEPLGRRLFNDARFQRTEFEVCQLNDDQSALFFAQCARRWPLWGRRSRFSIDGLQMIVAEVFLPASPAYEKGYQYGNAR